MSKPTLKFEDISLDDVLGDGIEPTGTDEGAKGGSDLDIDKNKDLDKDDKKPINDPLDDEEDEDVDDKNNDDDSDDNSDDDDDSDDNGDNSRNDDDSIISSIAKSLGYELEKEYAETEEGLAEFTKDIAQEIAEDQLEGLFKQFPLVQKHLDFVMAGGDPEKFFDAYNPNKSFENMEIEQDDSRTQKYMITEFLRSKGHDDEFIKDMINDYEDSGKLYDRAKVAQRNLSNIQKQERDNMVKQQQEAQQRAAEENERFWEGVANTIQEGKEFAGIRIPDREKAKFFDYISEPINENGQTRRDVDYSKANIEAKLALDYLMYKGFNLKDIIDVKAKTASATSLRDKVRQNEERVKSMQTNDKKGKKFDADNLDLKALFG
jgi:hypothetical protein